MQLEHLSFPGEVTGKVVLESITHPSSLWCNRGASATCWRSDRQGCLLKYNSSVVSLVQPGRICHFLKKWQARLSSKVWLIHRLAGATGDYLPLPVEVICQVDFQIRPHPSSRWCKRRASVTSWISDRRGCLLKSISSSCSAYIAFACSSSSLSSSYYSSCSSSSSSPSSSSSSPANSSSPPPDI